MVDATDGIAIGVLHGCIGKCCTEKYPSVFVNLADEAIWKFVYDNAKKERGTAQSLHVLYIKLFFLKFIFEH